jgi:fructokinase
MKYKITLGGRGADIYVHRLNEEQHKLLKEGEVEKEKIDMDDIAKIINKEMVDNKSLDKLHLNPGTYDPRKDNDKLIKGEISFVQSISPPTIEEYNKAKKINVNFPYIEKSENLSTGASIIFITPDSERTMCTYLGISSQLSVSDINEDHIKNYELIFLEGYLWDKGMSEAMFKHVINLAKKKNIKIAMSLSDIFCVSRHRNDFFKLLLNDLNIMIGNENEINELMQKNNLLDSIKELKKINKLIIITRSENGSLAILNNEIINCESVKVEKILDLTGAGDLFASGFFKEYLDNSDIKKCLQAGSELAANIIQKIGARLN